MNLLLYLLTTLSEVVMKRPSCLKGLKVIGKGVNTVCYKLNDKEVLVVSTDPVKESISNGWFENSRLLPKVEYYDYCRTTGLKIYKMPYYKKFRGGLKKLCNSDYKLYLELSSVMDSYFDIPLLNKTNWLKEKIREKISNQRAKTVLIDCIQLLENYGDKISLDFCARNLSLSKSGKLILRDIFYVGGYDYKA